MIIFAAILLVFALIAFFICGVFFLSHAGILFGFNGETKFTDATILRYHSHTHYEDGIVHKHTAPIIEYYNEFLGKAVEKMILNTGIYPSAEATGKHAPKHFACPGDTLKVEYTAKRVRVVDPRFVSEKTFQVGRYLTPLLISGGVGFLAFVLLVICILMGQ